MCSLQSDVDKLDIGKLQTTPIDLYKASNIKTDVIKKTINGELV